jgi:uncharacterized protein YndB with AHSA1/START domain
MPNIHHALLIGVPVEKVYNAITNQEGLSAWWTPGTNAKADLNSVAHFPFGADYFKEMKITELKPFGLVKWNCIKGADECVGTNISFKLLPGNKGTLLNSHPEMQGQAEQQGNEIGTLLIFHHDDWKEYTLMFAECSYTWGQFLRSLKLLCETGKGKPWPNQHRTQP